MPPTPAPSVPPADPEAPAREQPLDSLTRLIHEARWRQAGVAADATCLALAASELACVAAGTGPATVEASRAAILCRQGEETARAWLRRAGREHEHPTSVEMLRGLCFEAAADEAVAHAFLGLLLFCRDRETVAGLGMAVRLAVHHKLGAMRDAAPPPAADDLKPGDNPAWAALDCVCYDDRSGCVCVARERAARHYARGTPGLPPLTTEERSRWISEIASHEGQPSEDVLMGHSDSILGDRLLEAWADYCRDKGLMQ